MPECNPENDRYKIYTTEACDVEAVVDVSAGGQEEAVTDPVVEVTTDEDQGEEEVIVGETVVTEQETESASNQPGMLLASMIMSIPLVALIA